MMSRPVPLLLAFMLLSWTFAAPLTRGQMERRVALILGNGAYIHTSVLRNPVNDAKELSKAFTRLGFRVIYGTNLNKSGMDDRIHSFFKFLDDAQTAVFFYAGHGMQLNFKNYLVPIDFDPGIDSTLMSHLISLDTIMSELEKKENVSIIFLDACRDNPLADELSSNLAGGRSLSIDDNRGVQVIGRGLAQVEGKAGTLIAYATQPGNVASDGDGDNSPFTHALLKFIEQPGLDIRDMLTKVRLSVIKETLGKQIPWDHSSLVDKVYFKKKKRQFAPPP